MAKSLGSIQQREISVIQILLQTAVLDIKYLFSSSFPRLRCVELIRSLPPLLSDVDHTSEAKEMKLSDVTGHEARRRSYISLLFCNLYLNLEPFLFKPGNYK